MKSLVLEQFHKIFYRKLDLNYALLEPNEDLDNLLVERLRHVVEFRFNV